ncbi:hypothetical protein [Saprospira grandis]|uniref:hypothetical protein n=1 Tax=Saprospira grandis TaxID=1008 RepID=UPI0022DD3559|nr:hypothetical protein [Saprospira grandis]WBM75358.1 hypothetical protein OP864_03745 [Saprospira grandis]
MKKLLFLTLALIGLGLSSCQKEEELAPAAPALTVSKLAVFNYFTIPTWPPILTMALEITGIDMRLTQKTAPPIFM